MRDRLGFGELVDHLAILERAMRGCPLRTFSATVAWLGTRM